MQRLSSKFRRGYNVGDALGVGMGDITTNETDNVHLSPFYNLKSKK